MVRTIVDEAPPDHWPERLPPAFYTAMEEFNRGEYYRCHETLEALWIPERRTVRELYQGVLQIAVGCYHLTRANRIGAISLLERGARRLELASNAVPAFASRYGIDWLALIAAADRLQAHLRRSGQNADLDYGCSLLPVIVRLCSTGIETDSISRVSEGRVTSETDGCPPCHH